MGALKMAPSVADLVCLLVFTGSCVLAQQRTEQITDGVFAFNLGALELPYTSLFLVTGSGVMVVDPINSDSARAMLQEIRKVTNEPIRYVFYSHDHWDHTSGGQVFKNEGAEIIAHADANAWIKKNTGPEFDTKGWENTLEKTLQLNFEKAVFTHSPPEGGTKQDLADHLGYVKDIRAGVKAELRKGTNPFAIPGILKLDKYKDWAGYDTQFALNVMHFAIEEAVLGPYAKPVEKQNSIRSNSVGSGDVVAKWRIKAGYRSRRF